MALPRVEQECGTVWISMKRFKGIKHARSRKSNNHPERAAEVADDPSCIVRACSNNKKSKISTVVYARDVVEFPKKLGDVLKAKMTSIKRRQDRKKKKLVVRA